MALDIKDPKVMGNVVTGSLFKVIIDDPEFKVGFRMWVEVSNQKETVFGYRFRVEGQEHDAMSITRFRKRFPDSKWAGGGSLHLSINGTASVPVNIINSMTLLKVLKLNKVGGYIYGMIQPQLDGYDLPFTMQEFEDYVYQYLEIMLCYNDSIDVAKTPVLLQNSFAGNLLLMGGEPFDPQEVSHTVDVGL